MSCHSSSWSTLGPELGPQTEAALELHRPPILPQWPVSALARSPSSELVLTIVEALVTVPAVNWCSVPGEADGASKADVGVVEALAEDVDVAGVSLSGCPDSVGAGMGATSAGSLSPLSPFGG